MILSSDFLHVILEKTNNPKRRQKDEGRQDGERAAAVRALILARKDDRSPLKQSPHFVPTLLPTCCLN